VVEEIPELSKYASLSACLLIESSHQSRNEVIKDIKSSLLFENIIEAESLEDAKQKLQTTSFDACIFGSSLSQTLISSFIKQIKSKILTRECAFIGILKVNIDTKDLIELHSTVRKPYTKKEFFETVVRGVLLANHGTSWPGFKLGADGSVLILDSGEWRVLERQSSNDDFVIPDNFVLSGNKESIQKFCDGLSSTPRPIVDKILKNLLLSEKSIEDPFVHYFLLAIKEWKDDQAFLTLKEASQNLKKKLLEFKL
jgi:hypothetical protein